MLPIINICIDCGSTNIVSSFPSNNGYCEDCENEQYITVTKDLLEKLYDFSGKFVDSFQIDDTMITVFLKDYKPYPDKNIDVELCTRMDAAFIQTGDIVKRLKIYNERRIYMKYKIDIGIYNRYLNGKYYNTGTLEDTINLVKDKSIFVEYGLQQAGIVNTNNIMGVIENIEVIELEQDDPNIPYPKVKLVGEFKIINDKFKSLFKIDSYKFWMRAWTNRDSSEPCSKIHKIIAIDYDTTANGEK